MAATKPEPLSWMSMAEKTAHILDDVAHFHHWLDRGARIEPETDETRRAVRRLLRAWPQAVEAAEKGNHRRKADKTMQAAFAVREIRLALSAGARIIEPETKTPGANPRG
ncbi:hypothetical protein [Halomonas sp. CKK8]|uniref:hypothetical protein n=1 Tax=Halomonas sp. CKK8 TaxID=3036127 RepID=UPI002414F490|nr:hypothetical protein [Halomonas sp. CKK8]WFM72291.1 hypothetical protein P8934_04615 [Halomonas sp. CKK8]